ncbi:uncharacterized protein EDB91DRAFT_607354 [Suillus paluster]|uniref:uncharacterized protein n=1 Tax=Suillus paluster TaxID=48578 RepID=UPI001B871593|nr:uncharacterized protein EDB91DRAFT_607354 [Suillus paluster]KAG1751428.1 hypothetical protein EDB91DRAFT_607354 [Suillus paluster]
MLSCHNRCSNALYHCLTTVFCICMNTVLNGNLIQSFVGRSPAKRWNAVLVQCHHLPIVGVLLFASSVAFCASSAMS